MQEPLESIRVANTFIDRFGGDGDITHMKLQKLCYYAYGWWLALRPKEPSLMQSRPQVWKLGPVFQPVYSAFAGHRNSPILPENVKPIGPFQPASSIDQTMTAESALIDWIWGRYGGYTGIELSNMTHETGTPWHNKAKENGFRVPRFLELTDEEIRPYFLDVARKEGFIQ